MADINGGVIRSPLTSPGIDPLSTGWNPFCFFETLSGRKNFPPRACQEGSGKSLRDLVRKKNRKGFKGQVDGVGRRVERKCFFFVGRDRGEFSVNNHIPFFISRFEIFFQPRTEPEADFFLREAKLKSSTEKSIRFLGILTTALCFGVVYCKRVGCSISAFPPSVKGGD